MSKIIWVDSDPYIERSANFLKEKNFIVVCFNETKDCVDYIKKQNGNDIRCIITSMMERGGIKERGLMNTFQMIDQIRKIWLQSYYPFLVMITTSADEQACKDNGFDVVMYNDPFADRSFCSNCEPKKILYRGNPSEKYVLPTNWYRYGIKIRIEYLDKKVNFL